MATGQSQPTPWRGQPDADPPPAAPTSRHRSRWGESDTSATHPATGNSATPPEPSPLTVEPPPPPVSFPLPRPQPDQVAGKERQERSQVWLNHLETPETLPVRPGQPRRRRPRSRTNKLTSVLLGIGILLLVVAIIIASIPALRTRALGLFSSSSTTTAEQGTLVAHSTAPNSVLHVGSQSYPMSQESRDFWSVRVPLDPGTYTISISAPNYSPASGQVSIKARQEQDVTALLSLSPELLSTLLDSRHNQITSQAPSKSVPTGAQYLGNQTANQPLRVTISYRVVSLVEQPAPSALKPGRVSAPPVTPLSGVIVPDVLFTTASGAVVGEYHPQALPADHFLIALNVVFDRSDQPAFVLGNPAVLKVTTGTGAPLSVPGRVTPNPALLFALAQAAQHQGSSTFTCIGLVDTLGGSTTQPDPEDGLMLGLSGSNAHYFYRWGQLWTTNSAGHTLNPELPQANDDTITLAQQVIDAQQAGRPTGCQ